MTEHTLSSYNFGYSVQKLICDEINADENISALNLYALSENQLDLEYEIKKNLTKQGCCILVMTPKIKLQGRDINSNAYAFDELTIQIVENVVVNRASNKQKTATALDLGCYFAEFMTGKNSPFGQGTFGLIDIQQGEDNGLIVVKTRFKTYLSQGTNYK